MESSAFASIVGFFFLLSVFDTNDAAASATGGLRRRTPSPSILFTLKSLQRRQDVDGITCDLEGRRQMD